MKRLIAICLSVAMLCTLIPSAAAANTLKPNRIVMESVGHGEFVVSNGLTAMMGDVVDVASTAEEGELVFAESTEDAEIFKTSDEKYLVQVSGQSYLLTDKVNVDIDHLDTYNQLFEQFNVPEETIREMEDVITYQEALGNEEFEIDMYVPSVLNIGDGEVSPLAKTVSNTYYNYTDSAGNVWKMRDINTKYSNVATGMIGKSGTNAKAEADAFLNLAISVVGLVNPPVSLFGAGKSLYDYYAAKHGSVVDSSSGDYTSSCAIYDRIEKVSQIYTQASLQYVSAKTSHKVWINRVDTYQFYSSTGVSDASSFSINRVYYTQYWDNDEKTLQKIGFEDYIKLKLYSTYVKLNGTS